jgi:hypothetical protein
MHGIKKPRKPNPEAAAADRPAKPKASSPQKAASNTTTAKRRLGAPNDTPVKPDDQDHDQDLE